MIVILKLQYHVGHCILLGVYVINIFRWYSNVSTFELLVCSVWVGWVLSLPYICRFSFQLRCKVLLTVYAACEITHSCVVDYFEFDALSYRAFILLLAIFIMNSIKNLLMWVANFTVRHCFNTKYLTGVRSVDSFLAELYTNMCIPISLITLTTLLIYLTHVISNLSTMMLDWTCNGIVLVLRMSNSKFEMPALIRVSSEGTPKRHSYLITNNLIFLCLFELHIVWVIY